MPEFDANWGFQKQYYPSVCRLVGPHLLQPAPIELDMREATDFMVLAARDMRIAARVRRPGYANFDEDITIRSRVCRGGVEYRTEVHKIFDDGFGDWMFYGHATGIGINIYPWFLIDLHVLRELHARPDLRIMGREVPNSDRETWLRPIQPFQLERIRPGLIVAFEHGAHSDQATLDFHAAVEA